MEEIGFDWAPLENRWEEMFQRLLEFREKHGHVDVPQKNVEYAELATWVRHQRRNWKIKRPVLTEERKARLNEIGFSWVLKEPNSWELMFDQLVAFKKRHGHCKVPQKWPENRVLGKWVNSQRTFFKRETLKLDRQQKLEAIGFAWTGKESFLFALPGGDVAPLRHGKRIYTSPKRVKKTQNFLHVEMFDPAKPFNELKDLPPEGDLESKAVLLQLNRASRNLAELKGRTRTLPNPDILLSTLALNEAKDSSEIENIFTTHDELFRGLSMDSQGLTPHAKEVLHYREALWRGTEVVRARPLFTTNLCVELSGIIKENQAGIRRQPGTRIVNDRAGTVVYTPPEGEQVIRDKLAALERFANLPDDGLDPLLKAALIHYQFEAIHPFYDGNGRTGRILFILYLQISGLLDWPVLYLSRHIVQNKPDYYRGLRGVTERGDWETWLLYMLRAVEVTARDTSERILAIEELLAGFLDRGRALLDRCSKEFIELLFLRPYCKIAHVEEALDVSRPTASNYLRELERKGFVRSERSGREVLFINHRLVALLTDKPPEPLP